MDIQASLSFLRYLCSSKFTDESINPNDINCVLITILSDAGDVFHHADPDTGLKARFSMEYAVASAMIRDQLRFAIFRDNTIERPQIQSIQEQVDFLIDN